MAGGRRPSIGMVVPGGVDRSGTERVIPCLLWLIERLARRVDLHVIALRQEDRAATYPLLGATVHCLPAHASPAYIVRALLALHRRARIDLWHAVWGSWTTVIGPLTRTPLLLHLNGGDLAAVPEIGYGGRLTARGRFSLRMSVLSATRITVPSEAMRCTAQSLGIAAEVITYGVALDRWPAAAPRPRPPHAPARLLHVADLNRVKDQEMLLRALAALVARGVTFGIDIIGFDTLGGRVQQRAREMGLTDVIRFHGWLPHDRTRPFFDAAHLLLVTSRHEADPIVALEAAIAGVPTVGTKVGHLAAWAPTAASAVAIGDAAGLAAAIDALLNDDAHRCAMARRAQQLALAADADAGAGRVLALYEELAAHSGRS